MSSGGCRSSWPPPPAPQPRHHIAWIGALDRRRAAAADPQRVFPWIGRREGAHPVTSHAAAARTYLSVPVKNTGSLDPADTDTCKRPRSALPRLELERDLRALARG